MVYLLTQSNTWKGFILLIFIVFAVIFAFMMKGFPETVDITPSGVITSSVVDLFHIDKETSPARAENQIHTIMKQRQFYCPLSYRAGRSGDGGWDVCILPSMAPKPGCIVYSIGINGDWSFDEAMSKNFGCQVRSYDPSMGKSNHTHSDKVKFFNLGLGGSNYINERKWTFRTFSTLQKDQGHDKGIIDYLKFDIEGSEWEVIRNMYEDQSLRNVKQIALEVHIDHGSYKGVSTWIMQLETIKLLNKAGFLKWYEHENQIGMGKKHIFEMVLCDRAVMNFIM